MRIVYDGEDAPKWLGLARVLYAKVRRSVRPPSKRDFTVGDDEARIRVALAPNPCGDVVRVSSDPAALFFTPVANSAPGGWVEAADGNGYAACGYADTPLQVVVKRRKKLDGSTELVLSALVQVPQQYLDYPCLFGSAGDGYVRTRYLGQILAGAGRSATDDAAEFPVGAFARVDNVLDASTTQFTRYSAIAKVALTAAGKAFVPIGADTALRMGKSRAANMEVLNLYGSDYTHVVQVALPLRLSGQREQYAFLFGPWVSDTPSGTYNSCFAMKMRAQKTDTGGVSDTLLGRTDYFYGATPVPVQVCEGRAIVPAGYEFAVTGAEVPYSATVAAVDCRPTEVVALSIGLKAIPAPPDGYPAPISVGFRYLMRLPECGLRYVLSQRDGTSIRITGVRMDQETTIERAWLTHSWVRLVDGDEVASARALYVPDTTAWYRRWSCFHFGVEVEPLVGEVSLVGKCAYSNPSALEWSDQPSLAALGFSYAQSVEGDANAGKWVECVAAIAAAKISVFVVLEGDDDVYKMRASRVVVFSGAEAVKVLDLPFSEVYPNPSAKKYPILWPTGTTDLFSYADPLFSVEWVMSNDVDHAGWIHANPTIPCNWYYSEKIKAAVIAIPGAIILVDVENNTARTLTEADVPDVSGAFIYLAGEQ